MTRRTPISTRTDTLVPVTTLFRSPGIARDLPEPDAASRGRRLVHAAALAADAAKPSLDRALLLSRTRQHDGTPRHRPGYGIRPRFGDGGFHDHGATAKGARVGRSEEHTYELQSLMRISYAVFCLKKKKKQQ